MGNNHDQSDLNNDGGQRQSGGRQEQAQRSLPSERSARSDVERRQGGDGLNQANPDKASDLTRHQPPAQQKAGYTRR